MGNWNRSKDATEELVAAGLKNLAQNSELFVKENFELVAAVVVVVVAELG